MTDIPDEKAVAPEPGDDTRTVQVELGPGEVDPEGVLRAPAPKWVLPS